MVDTKSKIGSILMLIFIISLIICNFFIGINQSSKIEIKQISKVEKKFNKFKHKSVSKEKIYIAQNDTKKVDEMSKHHHATWYRTEGTIVHREYPTAAYNFTPKGTKLLVINAISGDSCIVEVTDRMGSSIPNRIDLSHSAFGQIANHSRGVTKVIVKILEQ